MVLLKVSYVGYITAGSSLIVGTRSDWSSKREYRLQAIVIREPPTPADYVRIETKHGELLQLCDLSAYTAGIEQLVILH